MKRVSIPSTTVVLNGVEYEAFELSDKDYEELDMWLRNFFIKCVSTEGLDASSKSDILQAAIKASVDAGWGTEIGWKTLQSLKGLSRLAYHLFRKKVKAEKIEAELKLDEEAGLRIIDTYFELARGGEEASEGVASESPKSSATG